MESRLPVMAKKVWSLVRVMFFMLKKGIAKRKFILDLNVMMKRGKIVGKALHNLMFHHHHNWAASTLHCHPQHLSFTTPPPGEGEYEFSCSDTPPYPLSLFSTHKKHQNKRHRLATTNLPLVALDDCEDMITNSEILKAFEMMITNTTASPPLPMGSKDTPIVELLRIKDSPLALIGHSDKDDQVDEAAEKFIRRFYNDRIREN